MSKETAVSGVWLWQIKVLLCFYCVSFFFHYVITYSAYKTFIKSYTKFAGYFYYPFVHFLDNRLAVKLTCSLLLLSFFSVPLLSVTEWNCIKQTIFSFDKGTLSTQDKKITEKTDIFSPVLVHIGGGLCYVICCTKWNRTALFFKVCF